MNIISIEINGETFSDFVSYKISDNMENLVKTFTITMNKPANSSVLNFSSLIVIYIDGESTLTGYIDEIREEDSESASLVTIIGRDRMCDLVDSTIGAKIYKTPIDFVTLVREVLLYIGYQVSFVNNFLSLLTNREFVQVLNLYGSIPTLTSEDDVVHRQSDSAFELIKRCADIRQLLLTTDGDGNFIINKINAGKTNTVLYRVHNDNNNNIISSSTSTKITDRYHKYVIQSKANGKGGDAFPNITPFDQNRRLVKKGASSIESSTINGTAISLDDEIRKTRVYTDYRQASNAKSINKRAEWEKNVRAYKGFSYECRVFGFRQNLEPILSLNPLWKANYVAEVYDNVREVYGEYLIRSVTYTKSVQSGSFTEMSLVDERAYKEALFEPITRRLIGTREKNKLVISPFAI